MATKRKECFAYSKEVGGDPVAYVEGDRTGSEFYTAAVSRGGV